MIRALVLVLGLISSVAAISEEMVPFKGFSERIAETLRAETELIASEVGELQAKRARFLTQSVDWSSAQRAEAWGRLGMLYQAHSRMAEAEEAYEYALVQSETFRWHYLLAYVLDERGAVPSAIRHYRKAARLRPSNVLVGFRLGVALAVVGDSDEALAVLKRVNRIATDSAFILDALADLYIANGNWNDARHYLERAAALEPAAGQLAYKLALVYRRLEKQKEAIEWLAKRSMVGPAVVDPVLMEVLDENPDFHVVLAERAWKGAQYGRALDAYGRALGLAPNDSGIRLAYAYTFIRLGRRPEAIEQTQLVLAQDPKSAPAWHLLAKVFVDAKDFDKAYNASKRSVELFDDLGTHGIFQDQEAARGLFAALAMQSRQFESAETAYGILNARYPKKSYYRYWLAMALLAQGRCEPARSMLSEVLDMNPQWGEAQLVKTRAEALCGDTKARRDAFSRAVALVDVKDDSDTRITRAYAELGIGRVNEARTLATAEVPHPDAIMLLDAVANNRMPALPFAMTSNWWLPVEARAQ